MYGTTYLKYRSGMYYDGFIFNIFKIKKKMSMIIYYYFKMILISTKLFSKTMKLTPPQTILDTGSDDIVYNPKSILLVVRKQARSSLR